jgi:hypothetical protein
MKLEYLGDALDHWKGSLFEYLKAEGTLNELAVDPMATDRDSWKEGDLQIYARLLHVERHLIIPHRARLADREQYFAEITHNGDLFLDPDTGIATSHTSQAEKYVRRKELAALLRHPESRVVIVYQHIRAQKTRERIKKCVDVVKQEVEPVRWCSYESPTAAMLFLCNDGARIGRVQEALNTLLGGQAEKRVGHA